MHVVFDNHTQINSGQAFKFSDRGDFSGALPSPTFSACESKEMMAVSDEAAVKNLTRHPWQKRPR